MDETKTKEDHRPGTRPTLSQAWIYQIRQTAESTWSRSTTLAAANTEATSPTLKRCILSISRESLGQEDGVQGRSLYPASLGDMVWLAHFFRHMGGDIFLDYSITQTFTTYAYSYLMNIRM